MTLTERLAQIDRLHAAGTITDAERTTMRLRALTTRPTAPRRPAQKVDVATTSGGCAGMAEAYMTIFFAGCALLILLTFLISLGN